MEGIRINAWEIARYSSTPYAASFDFPRNSWKVERITSERWTASSFPPPQKNAPPAYLGKYSLGDNNMACHFLLEASP